MAAWQIFWVDLYLFLYFLFTSFLRFYYINSFGHSLSILYLQFPVLRRTYLAETPPDLDYKDLVIIASRLTTFLREAVIRYVFLCWRRIVQKLSAYSTLTKIALLPPNPAASSWIPPNPDKSSNTHLANPGNIQLGIERQGGSLANLPNWYNNPRRTGRRTEEERTAREHSTNVERAN
jgi:hypothetical protein